MRSRPLTTGTSSVTIDNSTTCSCRTLLCLKWCRSTAGTPPVADVMNTAVPATRCGCVAARSSMNMSSGIIASAMRRASSDRPRRQVVMTVKTPPRDGQREPAARGDLGGVGREEREIDDEEDSDQRARRQAAPAPAQARHRVIEDGGDAHRAGDRDAVGRRQVARAAGSRARARRTAIISAQLISGT